MVEATGKIGLKGGEILPAVWLQGNNNYSKCKTDVLFVPWWLLMPTVTYSRLAVLFKVLD